MEEIYQKAATIKLVVFDVDGVLTDGSLFYGDDGQEYKAFNSRDGHGMKMLQASGVTIGIITGRTSEVVNFRMQNLGIQHVYQGKLEKLPAFEHLLAQLNLSHEQVAYVGDDVVDLPVMLRAGLAIAPPRSHELVLEHAHWITPNDAGRGAARDVCEMIMKAQGTWDAAIMQYLK